MAHWSARSIRRGSQNSEWPREGFESRSCRSMSGTLPPTLDVTHECYSASGSLHHLKRGWLHYRNGLDSLVGVHLQKDRLNQKWQILRAIGQGRDVHRLDIEITNDLKPEFLLGGHSSSGRKDVERIDSDLDRIKCSSKTPYVSEGSKSTRSNNSVASCPRCHEAERPPSLPACW